MNTGWVSSAVAHVLTEPVDLRSTRSGTVLEVLVREGELQVLGFPLDQLRHGRPAPLQVLLPRCERANQSRAV